MARKKIQLYAEAPYKQGYDSAKASEKFFNPYSDVEDAEADADDYQRGYDNAVEEIQNTSTQA
jgi:hypothetical protein